MALPKQRSFLEPMSPTLSQRWQRANDAAVTMLLTMIVACAGRSAALPAATDLATLSLDALLAGNATNALC